MDPAAAVLEAWSRPGPRPWRHALARRQLADGWPQLADALSRHERFRPSPPDDGPTRRLIPLGRYRSGCGCDAHDPAGRA